MWTCESRNWRIRLLVVASVLLGAIGLDWRLPARADRLVVNDPEDTDGQLDVATISHGHRRRGIVVQSFSTFNRWDTATFEDGSTFAYFSIWHSGDLKRRIYVDAAPDGSLYAEISNANGRVLGYAKVWRPDDRSLRVEFPRRTLGRKVHRYRWNLVTTFHNESHPDCGSEGDAVVLCGDVAPDQKRVLHDLVAN